jgi:uncharacterized membrane protein
VRRAAWLIIATILACAGLAFAVSTRDPRNGEPVINALSVSLYAGVLVALVAVGYAIHRRLETAVVDMVVSGILLGPGILFAILIVSTIRECSFGSGC